MKYTHMEIHTYRQQYFQRPHRYEIHTYGQQYFKAQQKHLAAKKEGKTVVQAEAEAKEMQAIAPAPADPTPPMMLGMQDGAAMAQPGQPGQQLPPADQSSIADDLRAPQSAPLPVGMGA